MRRRNIVIHGLIVKNDDVLMSTVLDICQAIDVIAFSCDITEINRLGAYNEASSQPPPVRVPFERGDAAVHSPVPSTSTSSKRARMDDDSAHMRLFLNSSVNSSSTSPYDELPDDDAVESAALGPAGDGSGSQLQRGDLQGCLQPALKDRVDRYIQERVADAVERAVARFEGKVEALQSRVYQLETALMQKETVNHRRQKVDREVSVSTYFRHCN